MRELLDIKLLSQNFEATSNPESKLAQARQVAEMYARLENCISVLSDLKARRSYLYYGALADQLGLDGRAAEIRSIWEDDLLSRVHSDDLQSKYRIELQFFQLLNSIDVAERMDYEAVTRLRVRDHDGKYILIKHRLLYISSSEDGSIWLALCLYNKIYDHPEFEVPQGMVINTRLGKIMNYSHSSFNRILSVREKEVLQLIKQGHRSKEIADQLSLSINTVNRHRQNIFQKLNVSNAMEACQVAETTGLL